MTPNEELARPLIEQLAKILIEKIEHKHYARVCDLAEKYKKIITNEGTDGFFRQVIKREDNAWFDQRKRLTNLILMPLSNSILSPLNQVKNSHDLKREIKYDNDANGDNKKELEALLSNFAGEQSLDAYTRGRVLKLSDIDPNAWIVAEWPTVEKASETRVQPYPFEASAEDAFMFEYKQYKLKYLCVENENRYIIYGQNQTVIFTEVKIGRDKDDRLVLPLREELGLIQEYDGQLYIMVEKDEFCIITCAIPHNLGYVPARRVGYRTDAYTNEETYINTFHVGLPYILDTVKAKSEKDLQFALTVFALSIRYDIPCPTCEGTGTYGPEAHTCPNCKGKKTLLSTSAQEAITLPLPREKEDMMDLNSLQAWSRPPTDIIDVMLTNLDNLNKLAFEAVWGKNTYVESGGDAVTAEQIIAQENSKYNNLMSCAVNICDMWTFLANVVADVTELSKGLTCRQSVGAEFSVLSQGQLEVRYKSQKDNGMSYEVISMTEKEIMKLMHSNEPTMLRKYEVKTRLRPFSDKTNEDIRLILTNKAETTIEDRVLWQNYEQIWDSIELIDPQIYEKPIKDIKAVLDSEVAALITKINNEQKTTGSLTFEKTIFGGADITAEVEDVNTIDIEAEAKAKLKGTVGGVEGIIAVNQAIFEGTMSPEAGKVLLVEIYGFTPKVADQLVKLPKKETTQRIAEIKDDVNDTAGVKAVR
jgi:hypothetical protein